VTGTENGLVKIQFIFRHLPMAHGDTSVARAPAPIMENDLVCVKIPFIFRHLPLLGMHGDTSVARAHVIVLQFRN
jgi:hypothetical protein